MHGRCNHRFVLKKVVQNSSVIIDPSCGALEISLVMIRLGVTEPKKAGF